MSEPEITRTDDVVTAPAEEPQPPVDEVPVETPTEPEPPTDA